MTLVPCQVSIEELGGTVWRSQAVEPCSGHGLPTSSLDRATHQNKFDGALASCSQPIRRDVLRVTNRAQGLAVHLSRLQMYGIKSLLPQFDTGGVPHCDVLKIAVPRSLP